MTVDALDPLIRVPGRLQIVATLARFVDGHGWFRTTDLSRVKRALSR
jgi:hypothetical protein